MEQNETKGKNKVLLIVEDFDYVRNLLGKFFQNNGYTIISVGSTEDALIVGKSESPSVIVVDYEMQKHDPYLALAVLHEACTASLLLMNGLRERCNEEKAKVAGAGRVLERVFQAPVLKDVIRSARL